MKEVMSPDVASDKTVRRMRERVIRTERSGFLLKKRRAGSFFCYLLFPIACFLYTLLASPRDTLELLGQILIKRNMRY